MSIRALVRAVVAAFVAVPPLLTALPLQAGEAKPVIWAPSRAGVNAYRMKMGVNLPFDWRTSFGVDLGFAGRPRPTQSITVSGNAPANMMWGSVAMPDSRRFFMWHRAALSMNFNPAFGTGDLGLTTGRDWHLGDSLLASVEDRYGLNYDGALQEPAKWRTAKSIRLTAVPTGTTFIARTESTMGDLEFHTSLGAEQRLTSSLSLTTSLNDIFSENPSRSIGARFFRRW